MTMEDFRTPQHLPVHTGVFEPHELSAISSVFEETCTQSGISKNSMRARAGLARILFNSTLTRPSVEKLKAIGMRAMDHWAAYHQRFN